jgi:hypothetical protein
MVRLLIDRLARPKAEAKRLWRLALYACMLSNADCH